MQFIFLPFKLIKIRLKLDKKFQNIEGDRCLAW